MEQRMIPQGDETITIQLTVKEALALGGARFTRNPKLLTDARRKVKQEIDRKMLNRDSDPISYEHLIH